MKRGFNPFELFDDVSKEITDSADTAIKTIQQGAVTFATSVSDAISGITETFNDSSNEQDNKKTPIKYQDNKNVTFKPLLSQRISVTEIYCDSDEQECEGPVQEIVLSSSGVELFAKAGIKHKILKTFNIKNAYLYKKGKTESGNPIRNAVMGGLIGAQGGDPFKGIVIGAISTPSPNDIWYIYIFEHDDSSCIYRLPSKSDGEKIITFLDTYALI